MPYASGKQKRAMFAAASGHGRLGIPPKVARSFIRHSGESLPKKGGILSRAKRLLQF